MTLAADAKYGRSGDAVDVREPDLVGVARAELALFDLVSVPEGDRGGLRMLLACGRWRNATTDLSRELGPHQPGPHPKSSPQTLGENDEQAILKPLQGLFEM